MGIRTWPEPHEDDRKVARIGLTIQAEAHGLDTSDDAVVAFIEHMVEVLAERSAENRWLQNIVNQRTEASV